MRQIHYDSFPDCTCVLCKAPMPDVPVQSVEEAASRRVAWLRGRGSMPEDLAMCTSPGMATPDNSRRDTSPIVTTWKPGGPIGIVK